MNYWNKIPLFRLLLPFICGIIFALYCEWLIAAVCFMLSVSIGIYILTFFLKEFYGAYHNRIFFGCLIHLIMLLSGYFIAFESQQKSSNVNLPHTQKRSYYLCHVLEPLVEKAKTYGTLVELSAEKCDTNWRSTKGKILVYFKKDGTSKWPEYGDGLILFTRLKPIEGPNNPQEYDYRKQAAKKGIFYRVFLAKNEWKEVGMKKPEIIKKNALYFRNFVFQQLKKYLPVKSEYGVAEALLAGSTEDLDRELSQSYSAAGVVHILSVSGLHIGLVYLVFNSMLFFMNKSKGLKMIKFSVLILFLWGYAMISGLSPSVLRAAMMLSLVLIGKSLERNTNTYNTLAASAFVLLIITPSLILNLGFQLSYLAVLGIMLLHPIIYKQWKTKYYLLDKSWQMTSVSLAAQAFTLPLILYYFHQMPNYFLIANLIVIPLASLILFSGIALVLATKWIWLCNIIGTFMHFLLLFLNYFVRQVEVWPYALSGNITISIWDMACLYTALLCFLLFYFFRKASYLLMGLFFLVFFQANQAIGKVILSNHVEVKNIFRQQHELCNQVA